MSGFTYAIIVSIIGAIIYDLIKLSLQKARVKKYLHDGERFTDLGLYSIRFIASTASVVCMYHAHELSNGTVKWLIEVALIAFLISHFMVSALIRRLYKVQEKLSKETNEKDGQ